MRTFAENMAGQLVTRAAPRQLDWLLRDCHLTSDWREFSGIETAGDYNSLMSWRHLEGNRPDAHGKLIGEHADRYSAKSHLAAVELRTRRLLQALRRAPQACTAIQASRLNSARPVPSTAARLKKGRW